MKWKINDSYYIIILDFYYNLFLYSNLADQCSKLLVELGLDDPA